MIYAHENQTMLEHVRSMLDAWEKVKNKYINSILRVLKSMTEISRDDVDELMRSLIILHDTGKGAKIYQQNIKSKSFGGYRHELLSAYYTKKILEQIFDDKKIALIGALTVMIHHEPILMGFIEKIHRDHLSAELILDRLKNFDGVVPELKNYIADSFISFLNICSIRVPDVDVDSLLRTVMELSVRARSSPDSDRLRLVVGTILLPLVLCDYEGSTERGGNVPAFYEVLRRELVGLEVI